MAANKSRASTRAPNGDAQGSISLLSPSSTRSFRPIGAPTLRVRISSRDTEAIEGSASPRKPKVAICRRSPSGSFDVACRSTARARSPSSSPCPSSTTRISRRPPASIVTSTDFARASSAFSTNSLIAAAGRSITSPAAMRSMVKGSSRRIGMGWTSPHPITLAGRRVLARLRTLVRFRSPYARRLSQFRGAVRPIILTAHPLRVINDAKAWKGRRQCAAPLSSVKSASARM